MTLDDTKRELHKTFTSKRVGPSGGPFYVLSETQLDELIESAWTAGITEGVSARHAAEIAGVQLKQPTPGGLWT